MSIKTKFTLGVLVSILALIPAIFAATNFGERAVKASLGETSSVEATNAGKQIEIVIQSAVTQLIQLANDPTIKNELLVLYQTNPNQTNVNLDKPADSSLIPSNAPPAGTKINVGIQQQVQSLTTDPQFSVSHLINPENTQVFDSHENLIYQPSTSQTQNRKQEAWWQQIKQQGVYVSDVDFSDPQQIYISVKITSPDGTFIGAISSAIDINKIAEIIKINNSGNISEIHWINKQNKVIYSNKDLKFGQDASSISALPALNKQGQNQLKSYVFYMDQGQEELAARSRFGESLKKDWSIITEKKISKQGIFFNIVNIKEQMLVIGLVISLAIIFAATFVYLGVTKPLKSLTSTVESISKGELEVEIEDKLLNAHDEFGPLARAFQRTLISLKLAMKENKPEEEEKQQE